MSTLRNGDQRPLTTRSIVASLLLGMHPPRLRVADVVRWCSLFDITENATRVTLSRMVDRGELAAADGVYELTGPLRRRQGAQDWALATDRGAPDPWDGTWWLAVVDPADAAGAPRAAADRAALRTAAARVRLAEVREGVWTRPANVPRASAPDDAWRVVDDQCRWWDSRPQGDPRSLAVGLFAPESWATTARQLTGRLARATSAVARGRRDRVADAFVLGTGALRHLRRDSCLPPELLPRGAVATWPADDLRQAYHAYQSAFSVAVRSVLRDDRLDQNDR